jgi:hypothetical protein
MTKRVIPRLALAATAVALLAAGNASAVVPGVPAIYVDYATDCTFTIQVDGGTSVTATSPPGPALPPGTYQVLVSIPNPSTGFPCGQPAFTLTGPGVNVRAQFVGMELRFEQVVALQPSSTYVAAESTTPTAPQKYFSTSATGSSSSLLGPSTSTSPAGTGSSQSDIVGSAVLQYRGELLATVQPSGRATLTAGDRTVASLSAGRYDLVVRDRAARAGFFLGRRGGKPVAVSGRTFVGERSRMLTLNAGRWVYFSDTGKQIAFTVR